MRFYLKKCRIHGQNSPNYIKSLAAISSFWKNLRAINFFAICLKVWIRFQASLLSTAFIFCFMIFDEWYPLQPYQCTQCDRKFSQRASWKRHMKRKLHKGNNILFKINQKLFLSKDKGWGFRNPIFRFKLGRW